MGFAQLSFLPSIKLEYGGSLVSGKRKTARPIATKRAMHLVFRARESVMRKHDQGIRELMTKLAKRNHLTVYKFSNNDNHLHLLIRGKQRRGIQNFLRVFAGQVAQLITKARKGQVESNFWEVPVWTRIVEWGKAFKAAVAYITQNYLEAEGLTPYRPRKRFGRPFGPPLNPTFAAGEGGYANGPGRRPKRAYPTEPG